MTNFEQLRELRVELAEFLPTNDLDELAKHLNAAVSVVKLWRSLMDAQSPFKTPRPSNIMRHLDSECREVLQLWMKTNLDEPRSRPPNGTEETELGHVLAMALTAFAVVDFHFDELLAKLVLALPSESLDFYETEDRTWRDVLCVTSTSALTFFHPVFSERLKARSSLLCVLGICYAKLGENFYTQLLVTLNEWATKWHPAGRIEEI